MKIDVWSDFLCPYCVLGKKQLENALNKAGITGADIEMKSFLLNPGHQEGGRMRKHLMEKYGYSEAQVQQSFDGLTQAGNQLGVPLDFEKAIHAGTDRAHALLQYAKTQNLGKELNDRLQKAAYTEGQDLGDDAVLVKLASEVGLDKEASRIALDSAEYFEKAREEYEDSLRYGARGVPFFVIDNRFAISGAQSEEVFVRTLNKAAGK